MSTSSVGPFNFFKFGQDYGNAVVVVEEGGSFKFGHRAAALRSSKPPLEVAVEVEGCGSSLSPSGLEQGRHRGRQAAGSGGLALSPLQIIVKEVTAKSERRGSIFFTKRCASGQPRQRTCALPLQVIVKAVAAKSKRLGSIFFTKRCASGQTR